MTAVLICTHLAALFFGAALTLTVVIHKSKGVKPMASTSTNPFERFFAKLGHVVAWPFVHGAQVIEVLATALKDEPEVKTAVVGLVTQIKTITEDSALAIAAKGLDVADDMQTVSDAKALWAYVTGAFIPTLEAAYKDESAALNIPSPATPSPAPTAQPAPAQAPASTATAAVEPNPGAVD